MKKQFLFLSVLVILQQQFVFAEESLDEVEFETESTEVQGSEDPLDLLDQGKEVTPPNFVQDDSSEKSKTSESQSVESVPSQAIKPNEALESKDLSETKDLSESAEKAILTPTESEKIPETEVAPVWENPRPSAPPPLIESTPVDVVSEPTLEEQKIHQRYKKYQTQPTSPEVWKQTMTAVKPEIYVVQKGDTLWDISRTLFADPFFWPKIWALNNQQILNPHEIEPNMKVLFYPGSPEAPPGLALSNDVEEPPVKFRAPLLEEIPASLPQYRFGKMHSETQLLTFDLPKTDFPPAKEYLIYYVQEKSVPYVGTVVDTEMGLNSASEFQYIHIKLNQEHSGKIFHVIRESHKIKPLQKGDVGTLVEVQGQIELIEVINNEKNIYRALVKKTLQPIEIGSVVMAGALPEVDTTPGELVRNIQTQIIGGQYDKSRILLDGKNFVFLGAGQSQGLSVGMTLPIYSDLRIRNQKTQAKINDHQVGALKIVHVTDRFSTGYILYSFDDIRTGDYVGSSVAESTPVDEGRASLNLEPVAEDELDESEF